MGIANPEAALEKLREFRDLLETDERALQAGGSRPAQVSRSALQPLIEGGLYRMVPMIRENMPRGATSFHAVRSTPRNGAASGRPPVPPGWHRS